jgi:hypothetical protein
LLDDDEARVIWARFSAHMDRAGDEGAQHTRDAAAAYAREHGFESAVPTYRHGQAVLVLRTRGAPAQKSAQARGERGPSSSSGAGSRASRAAAKKRR